MQEEYLAVQWTNTFYTYGYLLSGARNLLRQPHTIGNEFCRVSVALYSAFAVEACLNHVGERTVDHWFVIERKISWKDKLTIVTKQHGVTPDFGRRPYQTVVAMFQFRDKLAHGKTEEQIQDVAAFGDPKWLTDANSIEAVERAEADARAVVKELLAISKTMPGGADLAIKRIKDIPADS